MLYTLFIALILLKTLHYVGFGILLLIVELIGLFKPEFKEEAYNELEN